MIKFAKSLLVCAAITLAVGTSSSLASAAGSHIHTTANVEQSKAEVKKSPSTKLKVSKKSVRLKKEKSTTLTLKYGSKKVTSDADWSSDNTSIATVKNGKITAGTKAGKTKIKAKYKGKTVTVSVTVK